MTKTPLKRPLSPALSPFGERGHGLEANARRPVRPAPALGARARDDVVPTPGRFAATLGAQRRNATRDESATPSSASSGARAQSGNALQPSPPGAPTSPRTPRAQGPEHEREGAAVERDRSRSSARDPRDDDASRPDLAPFRPSPILVPPAPAVSPTNLAERADVAAIVERIVVAMRVGTAGRGREHRASLTLGGRTLADVGVELSLVDGRVRGVLRAPAQSMDAAHRIAESAGAALRARGIELEEIRVERG